MLECTEEAEEWWGARRAASGAGEGPLGKALLRALLTPSPVGMHVLDPDLRILRVNTAAHGISGIPAGRLVGRRLADAFRFTSPDRHCGHGAERPRHRRARDRQARGCRPAQTAFVAPTA
ncbi:PAS domain-containing protein [Streptomyces sp. NBC_00654]|uniref:PAS domain-containing protein n=1 Tax=Streptomyces sp. NBC_00654 TaxID=2975799 RepID=UPI00225819CA|nr:PAS domain-containing protein [Streptomyces sp. NBC_00654]MCX4968129.1 PAS domain-containing protein [Streptomyces sp. NBC_00654]